jgi:hypothetical protein
MMTNSDHVNVFSHGLPHSGCAAQQLRAGISARVGDAVRHDPMTTMDTRGSRHPQLTRAIAGGADRGGRGTWPGSGRKSPNRRAPRDRHVAMASRSHALYPRLGVRENIGSGMRPRRLAVGEIADRGGEGR